MSNYYNAFEMSPVPAPGVDAVAPEPFRGIYGMPVFVTVPTRDLAARDHRGKRPRQRREPRNSHLVLSKMPLG
jgi:hypothetical protein